MTSTDNVDAVLKEIAHLLRQRVEQSADMAKRAEERLAHMPVPRPAMPDFAALTAKHEAEAAARREELGQHRAEDLAFRERLLKAIEDQNALLRMLLERVSPADR